MNLLEIQKMKIPSLNQAENLPRGFNQIHVNALYSILDKKFIDLLVQPARKRNEYSTFCEMIDRMETEFCTIYIADRGYASYNDFAHGIENQQYFLIRCTDAKTSKLVGFSMDDVKEMDYHVDRILTRSQAEKRGAYPEREKDYRHICQVQTSNKFLLSTLISNKLTINIHHSR